MLEIETVKTINGWSARFTIGVQSFTLEAKETKEEAEWYCRMLEIAFQNLEKQQSA